MEKKDLYSLNYKELMEKGWEDTGFRFSVLFILKNEENMILFDKESDCVHSIFLK